MDNIEQYVRTKLKYNDVLVAIITDEAQMFDSERAKMQYKRYQLEIMNCKHPTMCRVAYGIYSKVFIFGVTSYMKDDEEYMEKFLNEWKDSELTEIIGIRVRWDVQPLLKENSFVSFLAHSLVSLSHREINSGGFFIYSFLKSRLFLPFWLNVI